MSDDKQEENNKQYAEDYARGRSGDFVRDTLNEVMEDHDSQTYKAYKAGEADRDKYGYKSADECGSGETHDKDDGFCFLTSACVMAKGLDDACSVLSELRAFRDSYVSSLPEGAELLREYYATAPAIVSAVNASTASSAEWQRVFSEILEAVSCIRDKRDTLALEVYRQLFLRLKGTYLNGEHRV